MSALSDTLQFLERYIVCIFVAMVSVSFCKIRESGLYCLKGLSISIYAVCYFFVISSMMCNCHWHSWLLVVMTGLYRKGLVYLDVPIADTDYIVGKVMLWVLNLQFSWLFYWFFSSFLVNVAFSCGNWPLSQQLLITNISAIYRRLNR